MEGRDWIEKWEIVGAHARTKKKENEEIESREENRCEKDIGPQEFIRTSYGKIKTKEEKEEA